MATATPSVANRLLAVLPGEVYERIARDLEQVSLVIRQALYLPNEPIPFVYFPCSGVMSLVTVLDDGTVVEVATVGNEGMVGVPVLLGTERIPGQAFTQIPGEALRIETEAFRLAVRQNGALLDLLHRYTQALFNQVAQTAACNRGHVVEQRCARWLLQTHDRVGSDHFLLTQEFLSQMLGARRASVGSVASRLQSAGLIRYSRGRITILDRAGLETLSCGCYRVIKREFDRLLGEYLQNVRHSA